MNTPALQAIALNELRLRLRAMGTWFTLFAVVALTWMMIPPLGGDVAMLAVNHALVQNTSITLAIGTASLAGLFLGLAGFYLLRGRTAQDMRSGMGGVQAAAPTSTATFLLGRWLGAALYLCTLALVFMLTVWVCHALRGVGPIQPAVYLQTYALFLVPCLLFAASMAVAFDSWSPLMGKAGDVIYFLLWAVSLAMLMPSPQVLGAGLHPSLVFDFSGAATTMLALGSYWHTDAISLGLGDFDAHLAPLRLPDPFWSAPVQWLRVATGALALLPVLPAMAIFHRFSPDRVKARQARSRRSPVGVLNAMLGPVVRPIHPALHALQRRAAAWPGVSGQVLAELALSLVLSPVTLVLALLFFSLGCLGASSALPSGLTMAGLCWGVLISDISARDHQAQMGDITGTMAGGLRAQYTRHLAAAMALGLIFMAPMALRWLWLDPWRAAAVLAGVLSLSACATWMGRLTGSGRLFLTLFMFTSYVAVNTPKVPWLDILGFTGAANAASVALQIGMGVALVAAGWAMSHWRRF